MRAAVALAVSAALAGTAAAEPPPRERAAPGLHLYGDIGVGLAVGHASGEDSYGSHVEDTGGAIAFTAALGLEWHRPHAAGWRLGGFGLAALGGPSGIAGGGELEVIWPLRRHVGLGVRLAAGYGVWEPIDALEGSFTGIAGVRLRDDTSYLGIDLLGFGNSYGGGGGAIASVGLGGRPGRVVVGTVGAVFTTIALIFIFSQSQDDEF